MKVLEGNPFVLREMPVAEHSLEPVCEIDQHVIDAAHEQCDRDTPRERDGEGIARRDDADDISKEGLHAKRAKENERPALPIWHRRGRAQESTGEGVQHLQDTVPEGQTPLPGQGSGPATRGGPPPGAAATHVPARDCHSSEKAYIEVICAIAIFFQWFRYSNTSTGKSGG